MILVLYLHIMDLIRMSLIALRHMPSQTFATDYVARISDTFESYNITTLYGVIITVILQIVIIYILIKNYRGVVREAQKQNQLTQEQNSKMTASVKATEKAAQSSMLIGILMEYYDPSTQNGRDILTIAYRKSVKPKLTESSKRCRNIKKAVNLFEMIGTLVRTREINISIISGMMNQEVVNTWLGLLVCGDEEHSIIEDLRSEMGSHYLSNYEWLYDELKPIVLNVLDEL